MKFSIGEMSKMHNISVQTLRYYERLGLLKPASINRETGYRYYSIEQFIILDLIKQYKLMGLSLEEISQLMQEEITPEALVHILQEQKKALNQKIQELNRAKAHMDFIEKRIQLAIKQPFDKVRITMQEERKFLAYGYSSKSIEELEINLRKVLLDVEEEYGMLSSTLTFIASYEAVLNHKVHYNQILLYAEESHKAREGKFMTMPKGQYLCLYYDDHYGDNLKYYEKLILEAHTRGLVLEGDFYEFSIMPKIDQYKKEKSLVELMIKIKE